MGRGPGVSDWVEVTSQAQMDALKPGDVAIVRSGTVTAYGSATVTAYDSATVTAYDSATVTASGSATVTASDSATVTATPHVAVHVLSKYAKIKGGVLITPPNTETCDAATWLAYYGVSVTKAGYATLYKAVHDNWQTTRGPQWTYAPGNTVTAEDFDGNRACGQGLHLCAAPHVSARYLDTATKYVAVKVKAADLIPLGDKAKVRSCVVLHEVDIDGQKVQS